MNPLLRIVVLIGLAAALGAGYLYWQKRQSEGPIESPPLTVPAEPDARSEAPGPRYPIPVPPEPAPTERATDTQPDAGAPSAVVEEPPREPLPPLNESTGAIIDVLTGMLTAETLNTLFNTEEFARRFVVTVDNLPAPKLPRQHMLFKRVPGQFLVTGEDEAHIIAADNVARYAPYVQLAQRIETRRLVNVYERFYPLFQQAYAELGNPDAYFNDRLVEVIDHLLETPVVAEPLRVVRPKVFYLYADPELEALSAGQKALLRMGSANAAPLKAKLREVRSALTGGGRDPAGGAETPASPIR